MSGPAAPLAGAAALAVPTRTTSRRFLVSRICMASPRARAAGRLPSQATAAYSAKGWTS